MSIGDFVKGVVGDVLQDLLRKSTATKRRKRRARTPTASERLRKIEKLLKPARRQTSRRKTVRSRSKTRRATAK